MPAIFFPPVSEDEIGQLEYEVTVLSETEEISIGKDTDLNALIIRGVHGLEVSRGIRSGLLLPQVMEELDLSPLQFLDETCIKAGMKVSCWKDPETRVYRFMGNKDSGVPLHGRVYFSDRRHPHPQDMLLDRFPCDLQQSPPCAYA